jgi:hypothetical protein
MGAVGPRGERGLFGLQGVAGYATNTGATGPQGSTGTPGNVYKTMGTLSELVFYDNLSSITFLVSSTDLAYTTGEYVYVYLLSNPDVNFQGKVLLYKSNILEIINIDYINNLLNDISDGPYVINLTGMPGNTGPTGPQGNTGHSPFTQVDDNTISYNGTIQAGTVIGNTGYFNYLHVPPENKSFIIDHPVNPEKYLVHVCLEGPEAGVYYRGTNEIINDSFTVVKLPDYVESFARELTSHVTPIYNEESDNSFLRVSEVKNNQFKVYGNNGKFNWIVYGKRNDIVVEPLKLDVQVKGEGPYRWI